MSQMIWDNAAQEKFSKLLEQIPDLIRGIAEIRVTKKIESLLQEQNKTEVTEKDMVDAFFAETPAGFIPAMKNGMDELGINYVQYGYKK